jgi:hypothetical protein
MGLIEPWGGLRHGKHGLAARGDAGGDHGAETQRGTQARDRSYPHETPLPVLGGRCGLFPAVWWLAGDYYPLPLRRNRRNRIASRPRLSAPPNPCPSREARYVPRCLCLYFYPELFFLFTYSLHISFLSGSGGSIHRAMPIAGNAFDRTIWRPECKCEQMIIFCQLLLSVTTELLVDVQVCLAPSYHV